MTAGGPSKETTSDRPASTSARLMSENNITRSRRNRSVRTAANGAVIAPGRTRISATIPTAPAPPWSYANTATATTYIHFPVSEPAQASSTRRRFGLAKTARNALRDSRSRSRTGRELHLYRPTGKISGKPPV